MFWNQFGDFIDLDPDWIRIRIHQILWIRIRIQSIRIHIPAKFHQNRRCSLPYLSDFIWNDPFVTYLTMAFPDKVQMQTTFLYIIHSILSLKVGIMGACHVTFFGGHYVLSNLNQIHLFWKHITAKTNYLLIFTVCLNHSGAKHETIGQFDERTMKPFFS